MDKKIAYIFMTMLILSSVNVSFAADNVRLDGMDVNKSIGTQGVMSLTNTTSGEPVNALCVDEDTYIYYGDVVPVTDGTNGITNANQVKTVIIQNYRPTMTAQQGYDMQAAVWYFTDNKPVENPDQQAMVYAALQDQSNYPDVYTLHYETEDELLSSSISNRIESSEPIIESSETVTEQLSQDVLFNTVTTSNGQTVDVSSVINLVNTTTEVTMETIETVDKICTKTIETVTNFYDTITTTIITNFYTNTTTTDTTNYYRDTTTVKTVVHHQEVVTTVEKYQRTYRYLDFVFNSVQTLNKQKLILFTATPRELVTYWSSNYDDSRYWDTRATSVTTNEYNTTRQDVTSTEFNESTSDIIHTASSVQVQNISIVCEPKPVIPPVVPPEEPVIPEPPIVPPEEPVIHEEPAEPVSAEPVQQNNTIPMQPTGTPLLLILAGVIAMLIGIMVGRKE